LTYPIGESSLLRSSRKLGRRGLKISGVLSFELASIPAARNAKLNILTIRRRCAIELNVVAFLVAFALITPAEAVSVLSLGPRSVQTLVAEQLFIRAGRWYLIDDGGICYTYLESPHVRLEMDRLVLNAHLSSRIGQRIGVNCVGADFASNVTLSGKLHGTDHKLILDDIRIDHVDDEPTRNALNLALQLAPQAMTRAASIDVLEFVRKQVFATGGSPVHVDQLRIENVATRADAIVIQFDFSLSAP
jgi:hypothetical protein